LAATDEKDLPTAQSQTHPQARIPSTHGNPRGPQGAQTQAREGPHAPSDHHPAQAASLSAVATNASFGAADRLHRSAEFVRLQREGARERVTHFVLYAGKIQTSDRGGERSRLGVTVSRRIGGAVVRNRVKRRVRECFRLRLRAMLPAGVALVVIARPGAGELSTPAINAELETATLRLAKRVAGGRR
jgi:ribonuclease P protein component